VSIARGADKGPAEATTSCHKTSFFLSCLRGSTASANHLCVQA